MDLQTAVKAGYSFRQLREMVSTQSLPLFLQAGIEKLVMEYYERKTSPWRRYTIQRTTPDFKDVRYRMIYTDEQLDKLLEGEPYREGALAEEERSWKVAKYGKLLTITYEALVNDDTREVATLAENYGRMTEALEPTLVTDLLEGLPVSNDYTGTPMSFAFNEGNLDLAITSFSNQATPAGRRLIGSPAFLVHAPKWRSAARTLLRPSTALEFNVIGGAVEPIEEPYLVDQDRMYLIANPDLQPAIEVDFLRVPGDPAEDYYNGPRTFWEGGETVRALPSRVGVAGEGFRYDTINYKVRHVLGVGVRDPYGVMVLDITG